MAGRPAGGRPRVGQDHDAGKWGANLGALQLGAKLGNAELGVRHVVARGGEAIGRGGGEHVVEFLLGGFVVRGLRGELLARTVQRRLCDDAEFGELLHFAQVALVGLKVESRLLKAALRARDLGALGPVLQTGELGVRAKQHGLGVAQLDLSFRGIDAGEQLILGDEFAILEIFLSDPAAERGGEVAHLARLDVAEQSEAGADGLGRNRVPRDFGGGGRSGMRRGFLFPDPEPREEPERHE